MVSAVVFETDAPLRRSGESAVGIQAACPLSSVSFSGPGAFKLPFVGRGFSSGVSGILVGVRTQLEWGVGAVFVCQLVGKRFRNEVEM